MALGNLGLEREVELAHAAAAAPFVFAFIWGFDAVLAAVVLMCLLLVFRHQQNIANLLAGKERKLGAKAPPAHH